MNQSTPRQTRAKLEARLSQLPVDRKPDSIPVSTSHAMGILRLSPGIFGGQYTCLPKAEPSFGNKINLPGLTAFSDSPGRQSIMQICKGPYDDLGHPHLSLDQSWSVPDLVSLRDDFTVPGLKICQLDLDFKLTPPGCRMLWRTRSIRLASPCEATRLNG